MQSYAQQQNYVSTNYGNNSLPIYGQNTQPQLRMRSRCPRGAALGEIGSCCGDRCTRDCARSSD